MASEQLLELAYQFRSQKLWNRLHESEFFAVPLPNGEMGICCIMGTLEARPSLAVYLGENGLRSLQNLYEFDDSLSPARQQEITLSQCCLKCDFENRDALEQEDINEVRRFAKSHGIRLNGRFTYPAFATFRPRCLPSPLTEEDDTMFCHALSAVIEVAQKVQTIEDKIKLGFQECIGAVGTIPMLTKQDNEEWQWGSYSLLESPVEVYPEPLFENDFLLYKLKKLKKTGEWMCEAILSSSPVQAQDGLSDYFPTLLMIVMANKQSGALTSGVRDYQADYTVLLNQFVNAIEELGKLPRKITVGEKRTFCLLRDLCEKLGIRLELVEHPEELEKAEYLFYHKAQESDMLPAVIDILSKLEALSDVVGDLSEILPPPLLEQLRELDKIGFLPPELSAKLKPKQKAIGKAQSKARKGQKGKRNKYSNQSLVLSVSLGRGCYRHIKVSACSTLEDLADMILQAFEFDNDHMYAFFMDDKLWSESKAYYCDSENMDKPFGTSKQSINTKLGAFEFEPKEKFKFLFDFGDEWVFQCKVLKVLEEETTGFQVVKRTGEAPAQYPDWEDEEE